MKKNISVTVCICTYNRDERLKETLKSLAGLRNGPDIKWEVLLIDNNSSDHTKMIAEEFSDRLPLRYVFEPVQGLSNARNRAIRECRSDLLIFTDDDVVVESSWLNEFCKTAGAFPDAAYFGGRVLPYWPTGRPTWLGEESMPLLAGLFVWYDLGRDIHFYRSSELLPYGASFAIRRSLFENITPFRADLGVSGSSLGRGEEVEYISRAISAGYHGVYVGTAVCRHWVDPVRLKLSYMYRYGIQKGFEQIRTGRRAFGENTLLSELTYGLKGLYQLMKGRGDRFRQCIINMGIQRGIRKMHNYESR